jgi:hypothetical protein
VLQGNGNTWRWTAFDLDLAADGSLAGTGTADYSWTMWQDDSSDPSGSAQLTVIVAAVPSATDLRVVYPNARAAALPWDQTLVVEASRPVSQLAQALPLASGDGAAWTATGQRTAESTLGGNWDDWAGVTRVLDPVAGALDDAGQPFPEGAPVLSVLDVGLPTQARSFGEVPSGSWGSVGVATCGDSACLEIYTGCVGSSGVAWQLETQNATEARVTFYGDAIHAVPYGFTVVATLPDGTLASELSREVDAEGGTVTLRFDPAGADRIGIELKAWSNCSYGQFGYLVGSEAR